MKLCLERTGYEIAIQKSPANIFMMIAYTVLCILLAAVSITITGFRFGVGSNGFHIPYVLNLDEVEEFSDDPYYSTFKKYTSIIWPVLSLVSSDSNIADVFYIANFITRAAFFAGMMFLMRADGLTSILPGGICLIAVALSPWLQGYSIVGAHRTFINHFTHTETTWVLIFVCLALYSKYRLISASAIAGIIFSINAFVSVWVVVANGLSLLYVRKAIDWSILIKSVGAFLLFALPTGVWIIAVSANKATGIGFSYIDYIRQLYPNHFLIEAISPKALIIFSLIIINGLIAAQYMHNRRYWVGLQLGFILLFVVGIPLPYLFNNRFVFNLHLLRSAGVEQTLAVILCAIAGTKLILKSGTLRNQMLGVIVLVSLASFDLSISTLSLTALALFVGCLYGQVLATNVKSMLPRLAEHRPTTVLLFFLTVGGFLLVLTRQLMLQHLLLTQWLLLLFVVSAFSVFLYQGFSAGTKLNLFLLVLTLCSIGTMAKAVQERSEDATLRHQVLSRNESWMELLNWIRSSPLHGMFLVPVREKHSEDEVAAGYGFQLYARRKVWVDWEQGTAVMWAPSFYDQWIRRYKEVSELKTADDFVLYARNHDIHNIVLNSDPGGCPAQSTLVKATQHFILCVM